MKAEYRFLRTRNGITRFARVAVLAESAEAWSVELGRSLGEVAGLYGDALQEGIMTAAKEYEKIGGRCHRMVAESLVETASDTSPDAVRCAAAVAAWKSFGRDESEAVVSFGSNGWKVEFVT